MIVRPPGMDLRGSLRFALGSGDAQAVEAAAYRQEQTIDAVLRRLTTDDPDQRREMVLLADEVGLGKTFVALGVTWSVLQQRAAAELPQGPVLVITPHAHALFKKWHRETERFLQLVAAEGTEFDVELAETPHELARALRKRRPTLVIARMPALSARLHQFATARLAALHSLLHMPGFRLSMRQRLALLEDWAPSDRKALSLQRSRRVWAAASNTYEVGFGDRHVRAAWARMQRLDPRLCERMASSWQRVRSGLGRGSSFKGDLRELCRAALGQTVPHRLPLVIVDEIHNWKNHPQSWWRFLHMLGLRVDRLLGLSATPFQLGPHELIRVLGLRRCLALPDTRTAFLHARVATLDADLARAERMGTALRTSWADVGQDDVRDLEHAWVLHGESGSSRALPPRLIRALHAAGAVRNAHRALQTSLRPFLLRHRRDTSHRAWQVGRDAHPDTPTTEVALRWRPGLDVRGDAELVHYLMMRAVQEDKGGNGSTSLGADLGGSYAFFRERRLSRLLPGRTEVSQRYLDLVARAVASDGHEHPKVAVTAERAFRAWQRGEKTLVFCFNIATVAAVRQAIVRRIDHYTTDVLHAAFNCEPSELEQRRRNFQRRLYDYRQAMFLLFQDHPLAGETGQVPRALALQKKDFAHIAGVLARGGPPRHRSRFDRRRVLAATEQVLVARWRGTDRGAAWLGEIHAAWQLDATLDATLDAILASDWPSHRRLVVEGVLRDAEIDELPDEDEAGLAAAEGRRPDVRAWSAVLSGKTGRATLAPYLRDKSDATPSLITRWHAEAMGVLPATLRGLAARMLRRMVRSPGFLARFLLDDPTRRPDLDDEDADDDWSALIHRRYEATPAATAESARTRFDAYLETLRKAMGLAELVAAYVDASRNRDVVTRVTGSVASSERDRLFMGFNTPMLPEVLVVTTVGQEGIDLHRECKHVIHHDLPWNPATLEQRTGRVDRIGSKTERMRAGDAGLATHLDVAVPYIAGTYDEHRFRVVHGRAHLFEVTMGGDYAVDGYRVDGDAMEADSVTDDEGTTGEAWAPLPDIIARDLRLRLEANPTDRAAPPTAVPHRDLTTLSPAARSHVKFWRLFDMHAARAGARFRAPPLPKTTWIGWGLAGNGTTIAAHRSRRRGEVTVLVNVLNTPRRDEVYAVLLLHRADIEAELGVALEWRDTGKERNVFWRQTLRCTEEDTWSEAARWLLEHLELMQAAFRPVLESIRWAQD